MSKRILLTIIIDIQDISQQKDYSYFGFQLMKTITKEKTKKIKQKIKLAKRKKNFESSRKQRKSNNLLAIKHKLDQKDEYRPCSTSRSRFRTTATSKGKLNSLSESQKNIEWNNEIKKDIIEEKIDVKRKRRTIVIEMNNKEGINKNPYFSNIDTEKFKKINNYNNLAPKSKKLQKRRGRMYRNESVLEKFSRLMKKKEINDFIRKPKEKKSLKFKINS